MSRYDGPTLRAIRESMQVPLRRIARQAGMSHGHLSKVERGEHGRPITPAVVSAYERVTGVSLADAAAALAERQGVTGRRGRTWRPGQLTDMRRLAFNASVGAVAVGGQLGEPYGRVIDATGRPLVPTVPGETDVAQLERLTGTITTLDLQYGGRLVSQLAKNQLRWVATMVDSASVDRDPGRPLYAVVAALAARAAWSAFDTAAHEAARSLFRLALHTAVRAGDADLRAHVLADVAAQHNHLGYYEDALEVVRLVEGDERVAPPVRMVLHGVKARACASAGDRDSCLRQVELAEEAFTRADPEAPGWVATLRHPGHLDATTGHAMVQVARQSGREGDRRNAEQRLARAVDAYDPVVHARPRTLCTAALAGMALRAREFTEGERWARQTLGAARHLSSARVACAIAELRGAAEANADVSEMVQLATDLHALEAADDPDGDSPDGDGGVAAPVLTVPVPR